jgi:hypothetical protein
VTTTPARDRHRPWTTRNIPELTADAHVFTSWF